MDPVEIAEVKRITNELDSAIPIYWVSGNRDMTFNGDTAMPELLARFHDESGTTTTVSHEGVGFIVLSSPTIYDPSEVPGEWEAQLAFIEDALKKSAARGERMKIAFSHHPLFTDIPRDQDTRAHLPRERREPLLNLSRQHCVSAVFCGHRHRNMYARDGQMEIVVTSAVGMQSPSSDVKSGYRIVKVLDDRIEHEYFEFRTGPATVDLE